MMEASKNRSFGGVFIIAGKNSPAQIKICMDVVQIFLLKTAYLK
jgi:hypothetical protein